MRGLAGQGKAIEVPARLVGWQEAICAALGCGLRAGNGGLGHAVAQEWVGGFEVIVERPSAHGAMEAAAQLEQKA